MGERPKDWKAAGLSVALDALMARETRIDIGRELQLPLLPSDTAMAEEVEPANDGSSPRGAGRPPGSRNKRTEEWVDFILSRYRSPLVVLAEVYSRSTLELAAELGCTRLEAFDRQLEAAKRLAPYLHQAQPQAVRIDGKGILQLNINGYAGQAEDDGEMPAITIIDQKSEKSEG